MKRNWKYRGCSLHKVPSLSNTAIRSAGATKLGEPSRVTSPTNFVIACFAVPSRQDGNASDVTAVTGCAALVLPAPAQPASDRATSAVPRRTEARLNQSRRLQSCIRTSSQVTPFDDQNQWVRNAGLFARHVGARKLLPLVRVCPRALVHHEPESEMRHAVIGIGTAPRAWPVAQAVSLIAEK